MTRYVNKKHGIVLGSGNTFFIGGDTTEGVPEFRDGYRAIVWARNFDFENISSSNVFIRTPAQQLIWDRIFITDNPDPMKNFQYRYSLSDFSWYWLNKNIGSIFNAWDIRAKIDRPDATILFKRRKDALLFTNMIEEVLAGSHKFTD